MGVVYQARHLKLNRVVALKMILSGAYTGAQQWARFRAETEAAARLHHPHIVTIYDVGEQDGRPYCAQEYVDGGTLAQKLAGTPQPARLAAQLVETLARAVQYAHEHGIVHRDLKPGNILLTAEDSEERGGSGSSPLRSSALSAVSFLVPKIADFGLVKRFPMLLGEPEASASGFQTQTGEILGTPSYMAPEQAEGKPGTVGPAADIYALGAILYDLLTGRPPFKGETLLDTLEQVRTQEPVPPSRLQPRLPRDLATICLKALAKSPSRRYASAAALADDLRRFLDGNSIQARPVGKSEKFWRWCRRNPWVAILTAAVAVSLLAGTSVSTFFLVQSQERAAQTLREHERVREEERNTAAAATFPTCGWRPRTGKPPASAGCCNSWTGSARNTPVVKTCAASSGTTGTTAVTTCGFSGGTGQELRAWSTAPMATELPVLMTRQ